MPDFSSYEIVEKKDGQQEYKNLSEYIEKLYQLKQMQNKQSNLSFIAVSSKNELTAKEINSEFLYNKMTDSFIQFTNTVD